MEKDTSILSKEKLRVTGKYEQNRIYMVYTNQKVCSAPIKIA